MFQFAFLIGLLLSSHGVAEDQNLIGFHCGAKGVNFTAISTLAVSPCSSMRQVVYVEGNITVDSLGVRTQWTVRHSFVTSPEKRVAYISNTFKW
jgi:hypothetical protein